MAQHQAGDARPLPGRHPRGWEPRAAHSAWLPSTCDFMWAFFPQVKREPLPGLGLESRISWHSSWTRLCAACLGSSSPKRRLLSLRPWRCPHSTWRILTLLSTPSAQCTPTKCTYGRGPPEGGERGRPDPSSLVICPHLIFPPQEETGRLCLWVGHPSRGSFQKWGPLPIHSGLSSPHPPRTLEKVEHLWETPAEDHSHCSDVTYLLPLGHTRAFAGHRCPN